MVCLESLGYGIIDVFPFGFTLYAYFSYMFLDEFVVCPVVCFLSFLIESSLSL